MLICPTWPHWNPVNDMKGFVTLTPTSVAGQLLRIIFNLLTVILSCHAHVIIQHLMCFKIPIYFISYKYSLESFNPSIGKF